MADYTKTITNRVNLFGLEVSTKWGQTEYPYTMVWGTSKWGYGTNTIIYSLEKVLSNTQPMTSVIYKESQRNVTNSLSLSEDMFSERLSREEWNYIFPPDTTEGENRISTSWSDTQSTSTTYTCIAAGTTTWT